MPTKATAANAEGPTAAGSKADASEQKSQVLAATSVGDLSSGCGLHVVMATLPLSCLLSAW